MKFGLVLSTFCHCTLLALGVLQGSALYDQSSPLPYFFWTFTVVSFSLRFLTACRDPGFCAIAQTTAEVAAKDAGEPLKDLKTPTANTANTPFVTGSQQPEDDDAREGQQDSQAEPTLHLDVSMEISSSCKESDFQNLSDPDICAEADSPPDNKQSEQEKAPPAKVDEVEVFLPGITLSSVPQHQATQSAEAEPKPAEALRFCMVCYTDQPLRAKHCQTCGRCVSRYDHHCPWLSTCIGEKNHCCFLCYLACQCLEIAVGVAAVCEELAASEMDRLDYIRIALALVAGGIAILLIWLLGYQMVLVSLNLTTWEYRSWGKITYLNSRPKSCKSPFSRGFTGNVTQFVRSACTPGLTRWTLQIQ